VTFHTVAVLALWLSFVLAMFELVIVVVTTEPGALERYLNGLAYHRTDARHTRRGEATETTTLPALTARTA
jgi:hypothetical protein